MADLEALVDRRKNPQEDLVDMRGRLSHISRTPAAWLAGLILWASVAAHPAAGGPEETDWNAPPKPVTVSSLTGQNGVRPGETADVAVVLRMSEGWHVNSHEPYEDWLIPTDVTFEDSTAFDVVEIVYPQAHDFTFSFSEEPMAVYEGTAPIGIRVRLDPAYTETTLKITGTVIYQACDDANCLRPVETTFTVRLPVLAAGEAVTAAHAAIFDEISFAAASTTTPSAADTAAETAGGTAEETTGGLRSRLTRSLAANFGNPLIAVLLTFLAGLLSAATPCVYPMIPITARVLMGRGGDNPTLGRFHALAYFVGIILLYGILGFIAGATGGGFNEVLRIPLVILSFAVLFALLGLSMLGLFEIQIPASFASKVDSSTSSRSGLVGTTLMGMGAGLVVSPCVGPVVIFILTQIAAQIASVEAAGGGGLSSAGKLLYGSYLMAGYGAGLGIPFLVVGLFSARLARPGSWMTAVRVALGLVILYFAYDYFHKALSTAGIERSLANAVLTGVVLVFLAVLGGVFKTRIEDGPHAGWHKVKLASTIIMLIVGVFFLWTGLTRSGLVAGGSDHGAGLARVGTAPGTENSHGVIWHRDFAAATQMAREERLPIFVDFYAHWCANCKVFAKQAGEPGPLRDALDQVVRVKVYDTDPIFARFRDDPRYPELKRGLPFFLILSSGGDFLWKGADYRAHDTMIAELEKARRAER